MIFVFIIDCMNVYLVLFLFRSAPCGPFRSLSVLSTTARGDMIETFKLMKGILNVDYRDFFTIVEMRRTRGLRLK